MKGEAFRIAPPHLYTFKTSTRKGTKAVMSMSGVQLWGLSHVWIAVFKPSVRSTYIGHSLVSLRVKVVWAKRCNTGDRKHNLIPDRPTNTCRQVEACYTTKMIFISVRHTQKLSKCMNEWSYNCPLYSHAYNHHLYNSEYWFGTVSHDIYCSLVTVIPLWCSCNGLSMCRPAP